MATTIVNLDLRRKMRGFVIIITLLCEDCHYIAQAFYGIDSYYVPVFLTSVEHCKHISIIRNCIIVMRQGFEPRTHLFTVRRYIRSTTKPER